MNLDNLNKLNTIFNTADELFGYELNVSRHLSGSTVSHTFL